jgi:hypothetical protein
VRQVLEKNCPPLAFDRSHGFVFSEIATDNNEPVGKFAVAVAATRIAISFKAKHRKQWVLPISSSMG